MGFSTFRRGTKLSISLTTIFALDLIVFFSISRCNAVCKDAIAFVSTDTPISRTESQRDSHYYLNEMCIPTMHGTHAVVVDDDDVDEVGQYRES